ncbi:MAG: hypothetical protein HQL26_08135 [Candidatus Omnitrophica bacterium]|nr:hypothetical protein [Candidatus Omnitrophota bacterium]
MYKFCCMVIALIMLAATPVLAQEGRVTTRDWNDSLRALNESLQQVDARNQWLAFQIEFMKGDMSRLKAQADEMNQQAVDNPGQFAFNNKQEVEVFQKEADGVYQSLKAIAKERQNLEIRLVEKSKEGVQLKSDIEQLTKTVAELKDQLRYSISGTDPDIEREKKDLSAWIKDAEKNYNKAQTELARVKRKNEPDVRIKDLAKHRDDLQAKVDKLKTEMSQLGQNKEESISEYEKRAKFSQDNLNALDEEIVKLEKRKEELNVILDNIANKLDKNNLHLDTPKDNQQELENNLQMLKNENAQLKDKLSAFKK